VDIINVVSVTQQATVNQWFEENDEDVQNALYWRQALDVRTFELSVSNNIKGVDAVSRALMQTSTDCRVPLQVLSTRKSRQDPYWMLQGRLSQVAPRRVHQARHIDEDVQRAGYRQAAHGGEG
jgi:hypothetical protein